MLGSTAASPVVAILDRDSSKHLSDLLRTRPDLLLPGVVLLPGEDLPRRVTMDAEAFGALVTEKSASEMLAGARRSGVLLSCGYVEPGPLYLAASRMAFTGHDAHSQPIGVRMQRDTIAARPGLFVEVADEHAARTLFEKHAILGASTDSTGTLQIAESGTSPPISMHQLRSAWDAPLAEIFG